MPRGCGQKQTLSISRHVVVRPRVRRPRAQIPVQTLTLEASRHQKDYTSTRNRFGMRTWNELARPQVVDFHAEKHRGAPQAVRKEELDRIYLSPVQSESMQRRRRERSGETINSNSNQAGNRKVGELRSGGQGLSGMQRG